MLQHPFGPFFYGFTAFKLIFNYNWPKKILNNICSQLINLKINASANPTIFRQHTDTILRIVLILKNENIIANFETLTLSH